MQDTIEGNNKKKDKRKEWYFMVLVIFEIARKGTKKNIFLQVFARFL
ncbi:MAG: hypothetical protein SOT07_09545 [Paludibacteraceae bacterium]|nr:hypothetical protein [Paludibacteraceae bacterium]